MIQILQMASNVATPLAFLGLVAACIFFAYSRRLKHTEATLQSLPEDARAKALDEHLTRYGIHGKDLAPADKIALIQSEMDKRHKRSIALLYLACLVFVVCFALAVITYAFKGGSDTTALLGEIDNRAQLVLKTMNDKKAQLESLKDEGAPVDSQIELLTQAIDRFSLLHSEYVNALRGNEGRLSHERLSRVKDFLANPQLLETLGVVYKPIYSQSQRVGENGEIEMVRTQSWISNTVTNSGILASSYFSRFSSEAKTGLADQLAIPE